eukprot:3040954-Pyramimonas_sp.AAC.1
MFRMAATVGDAAGPPVLRPLDQDLCMAAYGVSQEDVTRELQWHCGSGSAVGIRNFDGHACFVNAVAQVLLRLAPFRQLLDAHVREHREGNPASCAACALGAQAAALSVQGVSFDDDAPLAAAARAGLFHNAEFAIEQNQCDACEFFAAALGALTEAEWGICVAGGAHGQRSVLQQHVCGISFRQRRRCDACGAISDFGEIKTYLKVVPSVLLGPDNRGPCRLSDLIRRELKHVGEPGQGCPAHAHLSAAQREAAGVCRGIRVYTGNRWERSPPVLFVAVQRVINRADGSEWYDRRAVSFPRTLRPVDGECEYDFSGVVVHQGERATSGHYVACATVGVNEYAIFDDRTVTRKTWEQISRNHAVQIGAYVFAYVRRPGARAGGGGRAAAGSGGGAGGSA